MLVAAEVVHHHDVGRGPETPGPPPKNCSPDRTKSVAHFTAVLTEICRVAEIGTNSEREHHMLNKGGLISAGLLSLALIQPLAISRAEEAADAPLASIAGDVEGVHIDILSLKRTEGNMVTLRVAFVNDLGKPGEGQRFPRRGQCGDWKVALVDYKNKKKYGVVSSVDGCLCTTNLPWSSDFGPGRRICGPR